MQVTREPGPVKGGKTHIAFVEDPTGYKFELIQREKESSEPFAQVCGVTAWLRCCCTARLESVPGWTRSLLPEHTGTWHMA